jgi:hypothetical protein
MKSIAVYAYIKQGADGFTVYGQLEELRERIPEAKKLGVSFDVIGDTEELIIVGITFDEKDCLQNDFVKEIIDEKIIYGVLSINYYPDTFIFDFYKGAPITSIEIVMNGERMPEYIHAAWIVKVNGEFCDASNVSLWEAVEFVKTNVCDIYKNHWTKSMRRQ